MGEDACYLPLVDVDGRLREGPVLPWPLGSEQPPPPGAHLRVAFGDLVSESRLQLYLNTARERRLVLLYGAGEAALADALADVLNDRLGAKKK
jgi:hypothetical protein